jgi:hypothetical protein
VRASRCDNLSPAWMGPLPFAAHEGAKRKAMSAQQSALGLEAQCNKKVLAGLVRARVAELTSSRATPTPSLLPLSPSLLPPHTTPDATLD